METPAAVQGVDSYQTLFGGRPESVEVADHEKRQFVKEEVTIRQLPVGCYQKAFEVHGDEIQMVGLYVDRPKEWVERLRPSSYNRIAEEGRKMNADFFVYCSRLAERQMEELRRTAPDLFAEIRSRATEALAKFPLPS